MSVNNAPVVWVMQELPADYRGDLTTARGLGSMEPVFSRRPTPSVNPGVAIARAREWAAAEVRDGDYILDAPGCDPMCAFLAGIALGELEEPPKVTWLRWDRRTDEAGNRTRHGYYVPINVPTEGNE